MINIPNFVLFVTFVVNGFYTSTSTSKSTTTSHDHVNFNSARASLAKRSICSRRSG